MKLDESAQRLKGGGGVVFDFDAAERELVASGGSPEDIFVREWQREVFARAIDDLRASCESRDPTLDHLRLVVEPAGPIEHPLPK